MTLGSTVPVTMHPTLYVIVQNAEMVDAWQWLIANLSRRPDTYHPNHCCIYDNKLWGVIPNITPLQSNDPVSTQNLARLFIISQLMGEINDILPLVTGNTAMDCGIYTQRIEDSIKSVVRSPKRFRHALSEHLAFWVQLAYALQVGRYVNFSLTPPNFLPEDKGPDGLLLAINSQGHTTVEIRSVKSSQGNPLYLVASGRFRQSGTNANPNKQLEEFHLISKKGHGFIRLSRLVANAYPGIGIQANQFLRASLLQNSKSYNAMVVANVDFSNYDLFSCYHYVSQNPDDCKATYIGSDNWLQVAEQIRVKVLHILKQAKVW